MTLPEVTNDTLALASAATSGARRVWRSGYRYRYSKAGLVTVDLTHRPPTIAPLGVAG